MATTLSRGYGITRQTHPDCTDCLEQAHSAVIMAMTTGAGTASATRTSRDGDTHSASVVRVHAVIDCEAQP